MVEGAVLEGLALDHGDLLVCDRVREMLDNPRVPWSFRDLATMLEIGSALARRAVGGDWSDSSPQKELFHLQIESALNRVYGSQNTIPRHN